MDQKLIYILLLALPLLIGSLIAVINADFINGATEYVERLIRKQKEKSVASMGWFSSYMIRPVLWLTVQFFDWTDGFTHRGLKNGARVVAALYFLSAWIFIIYVLVIIAIVIIFTLAICYIAYKMFLERDTAVTAAVQETNREPIKRESSFKLFGGSTIQCRACGRPVSTDATECPQCGESMVGYKFLGGSTIPCRACGEPVSTDANECSKCGESMIGFKLMGGTTRPCRACGAPVSTDANICTQCGESTDGFKLMGGTTIPCRACGRLVSTEANECPQCGETLIGFKFLGGTTIPCRACGKPVSTDAGECPKCGELL